MSRTAQVHIQSVSQQLFGDLMSEYLGEKVGIILIYSDCTFGPDVDISTGVSCDSISILSKRYTQHILWLLVFLENKSETKTQGDHLTIPAGLL